jgi:tetrapyrrole methylase family protein/MazG family protein
VSNGPDLPPDVAERFVAPSGEAFRSLVEIMAKLRAPDGCPWDREQTHASLARHLLEETYETLEAIDDGDLDALREELGDLVLQVIFHSEIAFEEGAFGIADVMDDLREKLIHRHPHVFGDIKADTADEVYANWERNKRADKGTGVLAGIPRALPALARAAKVYRRAVGVGFEWEHDEDVIADLEDEVAELRAEVTASSPDTSKIESELGDVIFSAVSVAQRFGIEPETALRTMLDRFTARFEHMERSIAADGRALESLSAEEWQRYWDKAKKEISP